MKKLRNLPKVRQLMWVDLGLQLYLLCCLQSSSLVLESLSNTCTWLLLCSQNQKSRLRDLPAVCWLPLTSAPLLCSECLLSPLHSICIHCWISCCSYKLGKSGLVFYSGCLGIHICSVEAVLSLHFVKVSLLVLACLRTGSRGSQKDLW